MDHVSRGEFIGRRFQHFTVTGYNAHFKKQKKPNGECWAGAWECTCDCGHVTHTLTRFLKNPKTFKACTECGRSQNYPEGVIGKRFAQVVVQKKLRNTLLDKSLWECLCDCGKVFTLIGLYKLVQGKQVSCGCSRLKGKPSLVRIENQLKAAEKKRELVFQKIQKDLLEKEMTLLSPLEEFLEADKHHRLQLRVRCKKNHTFTLAWFNFSQSGLFCRKCEQYRSSEENELRQWLLEKFPEEEILANPKYIIPEVNEVDIYFPKLKIAIEYNGLYWHSLKPSRFHLEKREALNKHGIALFQVNSDEWKFKKEIVKSMLEVRLGVSPNKLNARDLVFNKVPKNVADAFLLENHLMGTVQAVSHYGLYLGSQLVALMSVKIKQNDLDISRFCTLRGYVVRGGFSKLLSAIPKEGIQRILSFVDLRYATGNSLLNSGFTRKSVSLGWKWTDYLHTYNRLKCRANMDERRLTEKEHALELGLVRIYDAGQALFIKRVPRD